MIHKMFFLCLLVAAKNIHAEPVKEIKQLILVDGSKNQSNQIKINYSQIPANDSLEIVSPHPKLNPKHLREKWSGISIANLLKSHDIKYEANTKISFIASNNYSVQLLGEQIDRFSIILATKKNGEKINFFEGGPQLVFPLEDKSLNKDFKNDAWWIWYISAIIVGQPSASLEIEKGDVKSTFVFDFKKSKVSTKPLSFPSGRRFNIEINENSKTSSVSISDICKLSSLNCSKGVTFVDALDRSIDVSPKNLDHSIVFGWDGKPVPASFGGPLHYCSEGKSCQFFILKMIVKG